MVFIVARGGPVMGILATNWLASATLAAKSRLAKSSAKN